MIEDIVDHFGGQKALAVALDVTPAAVTYWVQDGALPARRAIQIERLTEGKFKALNIPTRWSE